MEQERWFPFPVGLRHSLDGVAAAPRACGIFATPRNNLARVAHVTTDRCVRYVKS